MKQKEEREKFIRETIIKYFFDMSKSTYTIMVLGGLAALFKIIKTDQEGTISSIYLGIVLTIVLAMIGLIIRVSSSMFRKQMLKSPIDLLI